jgi:hypothetical protein
LGSAFAAVKAGILSGIVFAGSIGIFNVLLLYGLKGDVLQFLSTNLSSTCGGGVAGGSIPTPEECFSSVVLIYVPFFTFLGFIISLLFAGSYGIFYEYLPGHSQRVKAASIGLLLLLTLLYLGLAGFSFEYQARIVLSFFDLGITVVYAFILGGLYRRYTRSVEFISQDENSLKIIVDGRNLTGKTRTFHLRSSHEVRGEATGDGAFREWSMSGGVSIEDPKSYATTIQVNGDGMLKGYSSKKR